MSTPILCPRCGDPVDPETWRCEPCDDARADALGNEPPADVQAQTLFAELSPQVITALQQAAYHSEFVSHRDHGIFNDAVALCWEVAIDAGLSADEPEIALAFESLLIRSIAADHAPLIAFDWEVKQEKAGLAVTAPWNQPN